MQMKYCELQTQRQLTPRYKRGAGGVKLVGKADFIRRTNAVGNRGTRRLQCKQKPDDISPALIYNFLILLFLILFFLNLK